MLRNLINLQNPQRKFPLKLLCCFPPSPAFSSIHHDLYTFDEMPQRASLEFKLHGLLKTKPADPLVVAAVHSLSIKSSTLLDIVFQTSLLAAYARSTDLNSSLFLFDEIVSPDAIAWNAVINACLINHELQLCVELFNEMVNALQVDSTTMVIVLTVAARSRDLKQGEVLHGAVIKRCFNSNSQICNALMNMYAKCGDLASAEFIFEDLEAKEATSWNSMINGSLYNGFPRKSASLFRQMVRSVVRPDRISLSSVISACSCSEELHGLGVTIHGLVIKLCYQGMLDCSIENSLILFYSSNGDVESAKEVFHEVLHKNIVSWNSMIYGLVENHGFEEALRLFRSLLWKMTPRPNAVTFIAVIPACHKLNLLSQGKSIHGFSIRTQMELSNPSLSNCLLDMYLNCEDFVSADLLFRTMAAKDLVSWNTMISGCSQNARALFYELLRRDLRCSLATFLAILPSCADARDLKFGNSLHCWGIKIGFLSDIQALNALMLMYIHCGDMLASSFVLKSILPAPDIVSLNTIIVGYAHHDLHEEVMETFHSMRHFFDLRPDSITFVSALSASGNLRLLHIGRSIHALMEKSQSGLDLIARNALITMYFRCGRASDSELVFRTDEDRNLCSWSCMISGFAQNRNGCKALQYFREMGSCRANEFSLVGGLCACSQLGNLRYGREIHGHAIKSEHSANGFVSSALLDMYGKCGRLDISIRVFENSPSKSIASWNSMISAFGLHGHGLQAINVFSSMSHLGIQPTKSTFISILHACSHSGLVDEGCRLYELMKDEFGVAPGIEHDVCLVDMLGRAGRIGDAHNFVWRSSSSAGVWGAVLSSCADHGDLEAGKSVAEHLFGLEPDNIGYYVTLSNLYACHGMWREAEEVRSLVCDRGLMKPSGLSLICL
ncbi:Pentatricopeptide repeat-containing protein [Platanthera guangdongensis]|uniref:Pentatricopeptide repeat-containing protein n=1 Tax=Platanthera guangdongensis TaxID=2320717 RepID=A0ABR2M843_9ASPA